MVFLPRLRITKHIFREQSYQIHINSIANAERVNTIETKYFFISLILLID